MEPSQNPGTDNQSLRQATTRSFGGLPKLNCKLRDLAPELLQEFTRRIFKIELHQHLEGSVTPEMMIRIAKKYEIELPTSDPEELRPLIQVHGTDSNLDDFLAKFAELDRLFVSPEAIHDLTLEVLKNNAADNVIYTELRFSPSYMCKRYNLDIEEVVQAVLGAMEEAKTSMGIASQSILIIERQMDLDTAWKVEELAEKYLGKGVVGLDLANDEMRYPPGPFAPIFTKAKEAGLKITVHAGEAGGAENVADSITLLHADRIGHGVRILNNTVVIALVKKTGTVLELCFTSNEQTGAVEGDFIYPIKTFLELGLLATVNTDDPGVSAICLSEEFYKAIVECDLELTHVKQLLKNACDALFVPEAEKIQIHSRVQEQFHVACEWLAAQAG